MKIRWLIPAACCAVLLSAPGCGTLRTASSSSRAGTDTAAPPTRETTAVRPAPQAAASPESDSLPSLPEKRDTLSPAPDAEALSTATDTIAEAVLPVADRLLLEACSHLGKPYKWGATGPDAFDCSGFTQYVFRTVGVNLPRVSENQFHEGTFIGDPQQLRKGDLVFFGKARSIREIGHVGIVIDTDLMRSSFRFIHASQSGGIRIEDCNSSSYFLMRWMGARRVLPPTP